MYLLIFQFRSCPYKFYQCLYVIKLVIITIYTISVINDAILLVPFKAV